MAAGASASIGGSRRRGRVVAAVLGLTVMVVTACTSTPAAEPDDRDRSSSEPSESTEPPKPVSLTVQPKHKAKGVAPGEPVTVSAQDGTLTKVVLTNESGKRVSGELSEDRTSWTTTEPLGYSKTYTAKAVGEGTDGKKDTVRSRFTTATPSLLASLSMNPQDGETVGVGQPLAFYFNMSIPRKKAAERAIEITTKPEVEGAFYWFSDSEVHWRPKEYWPANTTISIDASIYGKDLGGGVYGSEDRKATVKIGKAVVVTADGASHRMKVSVNGKVKRNMPIAMGKPGHETPHGTYVVMSEHSYYTMDSSTYGVPIDGAEGYRITVEVATRMSNSGIFYHSAPWSVGDQGHRNVSHGCINLSTKDARWLQKISNKGDVIIVKNSGGQKLEPWDGLGDWQIPWKEWKTGGPNS